MIWNMPNILTLLRLLAAPALALVFLALSRPYADWAALVLFVGASVTDWFDGYLARAWKQQTKIGAMLDPIADKAMVVIALMILVGFSGPDWSYWLALPAALILFREVFVSGLREFLGDTAGTLKVTKLAKWKTTAQMVAIATLFAQGIFEHHLVVGSLGMDPRSLRRPVRRGRRCDRFAVLPAGDDLDRHLGACAFVDCCGPDRHYRRDYLNQGAAAPEGDDVMDVMYFAWVRERIGLPKEKIETSATTVAELVEELKSREERYEAAFSDLSALRVALDRNSATLTPRWKVCAKWRFSHR